MSYVSPLSPVSGYLPKLPGKDKNDKPTGKPEDESLSRLESRFEIAPAVETNTSRECD